MGAFEEIINHLDGSQSFVLEAGAGAGKTYTLIQTLNRLIELHGERFSITGQGIVCITYTNVAKNEIIQRLENNPMVVVSTIHDFLWKTIQPFQTQLKYELCNLNEAKFNEEEAKKKTLTGKRLEEFQDKYIPDLSSRIEHIESVIYNDSSYRDFENGQIEHDDVIS